MLHVAAMLGIQRFQKLISIIHEEDTKKCF